MMEIVKLAESHIQQIAELEQMCFSAPWSEDLIRYELTNPLSCWLVAVENGKVIGYVGSQTVLDEADMMNVAVHPNHRRSGVARLLIESLIRFLKENNIHYLTLEVRASNEAAKRLYDSLNFLQVGRRPGYYFRPKEDALILKKEF